MQRLVAAAAAVVTLTTLGGCGSAGESPRESLLRSVEIAGFAKALTPMTISKQLIATFEPVSMGTQPPKTLDELEFSGIEIEPTPDQDYTESCSAPTSVAYGTFQTLRGCNASDSSGLAGVEKAIRVRLRGSSGSCEGVLYLGDRQTMLNIGPNGNPWVMQLDLASVCEPATDG